MRRPALLAIGLVFLGAGAARADDAVLAEAHVDVDGDGAVDRIAVDASGVIVEPGRGGGRLWKPFAGSSGDVRAAKLSVAGRAGAVTIVATGGFGQARASSWEAMALRVERGAL